MVAPITKELSTKLLRAVPLLKMLAANPGLSAHQAADSLGITHPTLYNSIIPEFLNIYDAALKQPDFPANLLMYYNQHGNPDPSYTLTEAEAQALKPLFQREKDRKPEQYAQAYYSNPHPFGQMAGGMGQQLESVAPGRSPNLSTNAMLISYIMEKVRLAPIGQIQKFVQLFEMKEDYYMTHPEQLKELFKSQFGPLPGEIGFNHFMLTQPDYVYSGQQKGGGYPFVTGYPTGTTTGMSIPNIPGMPPMMGANPVFNDLMAREQYEDMRDDRRMRHQQNQMAMATQAAMAAMMQRSVEAKQPIGAEGLTVGDIEEEFDSQGNLVGRKIIRKAGGGMGGDNSAAMFMKEVVEMYKLQYQNEREEKKSILERSNQPSEMLSGVFKTIIENQLKMSPFEFVKGIKEMGTDFFGTGRTRETIDADRDWDLTMLKEKQAMMTMEHDWTIQERANAESKEHMQGFISGLGSLVKDVIGPKINTLMDGAMAQMAPGAGGGGRAGHGQRGPHPQQGPSPSGQGQMVLPRLAPGLRWVQTPQGLAIVKEPTPQEAAAAGGAGGMPPGMATPGSFEESEELRIQKQANQLNNFAHQLAHGEKRLQEWDQQLGQRERNAIQAEQYAQAKLSQANEMMRAAQISHETRSFEEFTQDQLKKYYENTAKQMDEIKKAITEKDKQEREAAAAEISQDDTTPVGVTDTGEVFEGEYEDPHAVPDDVTAVPSNASRDDAQEQGTAPG